MGPCVGWVCSIKARDPLAGPFSLTPLFPMANIPVERTDSGFPMWLLGLLGLLLLGLLLWFFVGSDDDDVAVVDDVEEVGVVDAGVTDPVPVAALDMSNLYVTRVTGDRTFFVAPSEAQADMETLVVLDQSASPDVPGIEGQVDINPGQRVSLTGGRMEPMGDSDLAGMGIPDDDLNAMTTETDIIRVDGGSVNILEDDMAAPVEVGE